MGGIVSTPTTTTTSVVAKTTSTTAKTSSTVVTTSKTSSTTSTSATSKTTSIISSSTPVSSSSVTSSSVKSVSSVSSTAAVSTISVTPTSSSATSVSSTSSTASTSSVSSAAAVSTASVTPTSSSATSVSSTASTSSVSSVSSATAVSTVAVTATNVNSTILVFARDSGTGYSVTSGFNGHGIPYQLVIVPQAGTVLPTLTNDNITGNYGGIVVLSEVAYNYNGTFASALSTAQWASLYSYQTQFGVRMVRLDVYPGPDFGTTTTIAGAGCCNAGVEQLISITDSSKFPTANIKTWAGMSTSGLWHYPATITNSTIATEIAQFAPSADGTFTSNSTAAIINTFTGPNRQQMVFFTSWATDWSPTSTFLQHAYINWLTRGLYVGRRRIYFNSQIDDVHLETDLYIPNGTTFRIRPGDLDAHVSWMASVNSRLPAGSNYTVELGHNGNGNIEAAVAVNDNNAKSVCTPDTAIEYADQIDTALEFQKPLGTGTNIWPTTPTSYVWSLTCAKLDALGAWFMNTTNRDSFMHISHTFTHEALDNSTYADTSKEISFNQAWLSQVGISNAKFFSAHGIIPPAITGLHNGDAINAWVNNGITAVVGDNTRSVLLNTQNEFWALTTTNASNGYAGLEVMPRWATTIYYNCDFPNCTTSEWINTSGGAGNFTALLANALQVNSWHLLALRHDPFMFHQANLRQIDVDTFTVGTQTGQLSLLMIWVETILQEMIRLTSWPIITLKHDDLAITFTNRQILDGCAPNLNYLYSTDGTSITGVKVSTIGNTCAVPVPVTFPGTASTTTAGTTKEQIGTDPLTIWVPMNGSPVTFTLGTPVPLTS